MHGVMVDKSVRVRLLKVVFKFTSFSRYVMTTVIFSTSTLRCTRHSATSSDVIQFIQELDKPLIIWENSNLLGRNQCQYLSGMKDDYFYGSPRLGELCRHEPKRLGAY